MDSSGNVYIADTLNSRIRLVSPNSATINTVIGTGQAAYFGDNGPGLQAAVNFPAGLSFDSSGNLIIADTDNSVIRKFAPGGLVGRQTGDFCGRRSHRQPIRRIFDHRAGGMDRDLRIESSQHDH